MMETNALGKEYKIDVKVWNSPEILIAMVQGKEAQFFAFPLTVVSKLYNKGLNVKLMNVNTWGVASFISKDPSVKSWKDLKGKTIYIGLKSSPPDVYTHYFLDKEGLKEKTDYNVIYANKAEILNLVISGKADNAVTIEPDTTAVLSKNKNFKIIANFEEEWQKYKGDKSSIPTAGFGVIGEVAEKDPELVKKFNALIVNNGTHEYTNAYTGEKTLLRNDFLPIVKRTNYYYSVDEHLDEYPLADTWREFYKNEIKDFSTLYQLYLLTQSHLRIENFNNVINKILHTTPRIILNKIIHHFKTFSNNEIMEKIVYLLYKEYKEENKEYLFETSKAFFIELLKENPTNLVHKRNKNENYNSIFDLEYSIPTIVFRTLSEYYDEKTFTENLILKLNFENKIAIYKLRENFYSLLEIANAVELGLVEKDLLIKSIFS